MKQKQYNLSNNTLELHVEKASPFARSILFRLALISVLLPLIIIPLLIMDGNGLQFGFFVIFFVFGIITFLFLRMALWNTYGKEVITFEVDHLRYFADYRWFKDGSKTYPYNLPLLFDFEIINEENQLGTLIIHTDETLTCVTLMPIDQSQELIKELNRRYSPHED